MIIDCAAIRRLQIEKKRPGRRRLKSAYTHSRSPPGYAHSLCTPFLVTELVALDDESVLEDRMLLRARWVVQRNVYHCPVSSEEITRLS